MQLDLIIFIRPQLIEILYKTTKHNKSDFNSFKPYVLCKTTH